MEISINNNIKEYLLARAKEITNSENVITILNKEIQGKAELDTIKSFFGIKNYALFFSSIAPTMDTDLTKFRYTDLETGISKYTYNYIENCLDKREEFIELLTILNEESIDYNKQILDIFNVSIEMSPKEVALKIRAYFNNFIHDIGLDNFTGCEKFFNRIAIFLEEHGILVYHTTVNTHETNFSGCFIKKNIYPLILVHGSSTKRNIFTILHEFAHLLLNTESYIDNSTNDFYNTNKEEQWCNEFAKWFVVYNNTLNIADKTTLKGVRKLSDEIYLSNEAIIYTLSSVKKINENEKFQLLNLLKKFNEDFKNKDNKGGHSNPFYNLLINGITQANKFIYAKEKKLISSSDFYRFWSGKKLNIPKIKLLLSDGGI